MNRKSRNENFQPKAGAPVPYSASLLSYHVSRVSAVFVINKEK
jgi:hypothetical protein